MQGLNYKGKVHSQKFGIAICGKGTMHNAHKRQVGFWEAYVKKYELIETYVKNIISNLKKHNHKAAY